MDGRDVDELIREARAEARAAVKARLREELERDLLREVRERLAQPRDPPAAAPPESPKGDALWVYCVVREDFPELPREIEGVHPGAAPFPVRAEGIAALVSVVPLTDFGEDALKRNLNDLDWLEAVARAHETVIEAALGGGAVVPMRVCTIFRGTEHVRGMLGRSRTALERQLDRLAGAAEWGVKVMADRARVAEVARGRGRDPSRGPAHGEGGAYLGRKQEDRDLRGVAETILDEAVRECHARLEEWASASEVLPPQRPDLAEYDGEMVFNGTYLLDDDRAETFAAVVDELGRQYASWGLSFELTGPWPAFHFATLEESIT